MAKKKPRRTKIDDVSDGLKIFNDFIDSLTKNAPQIADTMQRIFNSFGAPAQEQLPPPYERRFNIIPPAPPASISPYELFGLRPDAPQDTFKQRYRDLMKIYHPDTGTHNDAMAKRLNIAWAAIKQEKGWA